MQFDHGGGAVLRDICPKAGPVACRRIAVYGHVLIADKADLAKANRPKDQHDRGCEEPCQTLIPGGRLTTATGNGHGGCLGRIEQGKTKGIGRIEEGKENAGQKGRLKQGADRHNRRPAQKGQGIGAPGGLGPHLLRG